VVDTFRAARTGDREAEAGILLVQVLSARRRHADAETALVRLHALTAETERLPLRLAVALVAARRIAAGAVALAVKETEGVVGRAERAGLLRLRGEAGLLLDQLQRKRAS
jgi:hypothetical protein